MKDKKAFQNLHVPVEDGTQVLFFFFNATLTWSPNRIQLPTDFHFFSKFFWSMLWKPQPWESTDVYRLQVTQSVPKRSELRSLGLVKNLDSSEEHGCRCAGRWGLTPGSQSAFPGSMCSPIPTHLARCAHTKASYIGKKHLPNSAWLCSPPNANGPEAKVNWRYFTAFTKCL